jgi:hypothetical protein
MIEENERLERENQDIHMRNLDFERRLLNNEYEGQTKDCTVGQWGSSIAEYEVRMRKMRKEETLIGKREKLYERDMQDLIEYVKWIQTDLCMLRDRGRVSEKIISDLKRSGEDSVDSLMNTLSTNRQR